MCSAGHPRWFVSFSQLSGPKLVLVGFNHSDQQGLRLLTYLCILLTKLKVFLSFLYVPKFQSCSSKHNLCTTKIQWSLCSRHQPCLVNKLWQLCIFFFLNSTFGLELKRIDEEWSKSQRTWYYINLNCRFVFGDEALLFRTAGMHQAGYVQGWPWNWKSISTQKSSESKEVFSQIWSKWIFSRNHYISFAFAHSTCNLSRCRIIA